MPIVCLTGKADSTLKGRFMGRHLCTVQGAAFLPAPHATLLVKMKTIMTKMIMMMVMMMMKSKFYRPFRDQDSMCPACLLTWT